MVARAIFRRYLLLTVVASVAGRLMVRRAASMRARSGHSVAADRLETVGSLLQRARRKR